MHSTLIIHQIQVERSIGSWDSPYLMPICIARTYLSLNDSHRLRHPRHTHSDIVCGHTNPICKQKVITQNVQLERSNGEIMCIDYLRLCLPATCSNADQFCLSGIYLSIYHSGFGLLHGLLPLSGAGLSLRMLYMSLSVVAHGHRSCVSCVTHAATFSARSLNHFSSSAFEVKKELRMLSTALPR